MHKSLEGVGLKGLDCDNQDLSDEKGSDTVDIDLVGATADNEIAGDAKENEKIDAEVEGAWREQRETSPSSCGESGGSEKDEAPVELRPIAPKHAEGEGDGEAGHIKEWNADTGISETLMLHVKMVTPHGDGGGNAQDDNGGSESGPEPTQRFVNADVPGANQSGLQDIEDEPAKENDSMDVEQSGRWESRVDKPSVDGPAETVDHDHCDENRHREVKVFL